MTVNCNCGSGCSPIGACCFQGEEGIVYGDFGDAQDDNSSQTYRIDADDGELREVAHDPNDTNPNFLRIEVRCNACSPGNGCETDCVPASCDEQGLRIRFNSFDAANDYRTWIERPNINPEQLFILRVITTEDTTYPEGTAFYYEFSAWSTVLGVAELRFFKQDLTATSDIFPEISVAGGNIWGDNPNIAAYPKSFYDTTSCRQLTEKECLNTDNSICFLGVGSSCDLCPDVEGGSTEADDCGCWSGSADICNEALCSSERLEDCGMTSDEYFSFSALDKDGTEQDGITIGTSPPYKNFTQYSQCGCSNSCPSGPNCCNQEDWDVNANLGEMDLCFIQAFQQTSLHCCSPQGDVFIDGVIQKHIRTCGEESDFLDVKCGNCSIGDACSGCACDHQVLSFGNILTSMPKIIIPVTSTITIGNAALDNTENTKIVFQRSDFINKLTAVTLDGADNPSTNSIISITNLDYPEGSPPRIGDTEDGLTFKYLDDIVDEWHNDGTVPSADAAAAKTDLNSFFTEMNSEWQMQTYCTGDLPDIKAAAVTKYGPGGDSAYTTLFAGDGGAAWYHNQLLRQPVFLRIWTENNKAVTAHRTMESNDCCLNEQDPTYHMDQEYFGNSQSERNMGPNGIEPNCETDSFSSGGNTYTNCKWCNPYRLGAPAAGVNGCTSYFDGNGNRITADPITNVADCRFPIQPHEYQVEIWYIGTIANICDDESDAILHPTDFKLMGTINEAPNCSDGLSGAEAGKWDTCQTLYYQHGNRNTELVPFVLADDGSADPWNQSITFNTDCVECDFDNEPPCESKSFCNYSGIDEGSLTRTISMVSMDRGSGGEEPVKGIQTIMPVAAVDWDETRWYDADPKHSFEEIAMGKPQVIGRFTELPFMNVYENKIDENTNGFYLTISAFHMDGIERVEFYLDGGTSGTSAMASTSQRAEHPLEDAVGKIAYDENGNLLRGLMEYTVKIQTVDSDGANLLTGGAHEIRAKIFPKVSTEGRGLGSARFLYGEPITGNAEVILSGGSKGNYKNYGPISGENWPVSKATWPKNVPDGPEWVDSGGGRMVQNKNPIFGSDGKWNLYNNGFDYYASEGDADTDTTTAYPKDTYIFGGTSQRELLLNGYESFWFNFNPDPKKVYVGNAGEEVPDGAPDGSGFVTSIADAFAFLDDLSEGVRHDAEIILMKGTVASPREYTWLNDKINESFPAGGDWCRNAPEKKSLVIRGESAEEKETTRIVFPPMPDRRSVPYSNFALYIKDLTILTNLTGELNTSEHSCLRCLGSNSRLILENIVFDSVCKNMIRASELINSSDEVVCGDSLQRNSSGVVSGGVDYSKCRQVSTRPNDEYEAKLPCAYDETLCHPDCCQDRNSSAPDCTGCDDGCVGCSAACTCGANCACRTTLVEWWPYHCADITHYEATTDLAPQVQCGGTCPTDCLGVFDNNLNSSVADSIRCLGTDSGHCMLLGQFNDELAHLAQGTEWEMGAYSKSLESRDVQGPTVKDGIFYKHVIAGNNTADLITNKGHGLVMDYWLTNVNGLSGTFVIHNDIIQWQNDRLFWAIKQADDYDDGNVYNYDDGSEYPRGVYNFNCFVDNRMLINFKADSMNARFIHMPGPGYPARDVWSLNNGRRGSEYGHANNYGVVNIRNQAFVDIHIEDLGTTNNTYAQSVNHIYIENWVTTIDSERRCTNSSNVPCGYAQAAGKLPFGDMSVSTKDGLWYGRKKLTNVHIKDTLFAQLGTGTFSWDSLGTTYGNNGISTYRYNVGFDWGPKSPGKMGSGFSIDLDTIISQDGKSTSSNSVPFYWRGSHGVKIDNVRQQQTSSRFELLLGGVDPTGSDIVAGIDAKNVTEGPVVHLSTSPRNGRTSIGEPNTNPWASFGNHWKTDKTIITKLQNTLFAPNSEGYLVSKAKNILIAETVIKGSNTLTADGKTACWGNVAIEGCDGCQADCGGVDPYKFPSEAHSNLIAAAEDTNNANILKHGNPNIGGMLLEFANPKNQYKDICSWSSGFGVCTRVGPKDGRFLAQGATNWAWSQDDNEFVDNPDGECAGQCLRGRDHYFIDIDSEKGRIDLTWIPIIDECTCDKF